MNNIDEKFKDASPEQTVARILEILPKTDCTPPNAGLNPAFRTASAFT